MKKQNYFLYFLCTTIIVLIGCSSYDKQHKLIFRNYYQANLQTADTLVSEKLKAMDKKDEDRPLLLLEKASISLASNKPEEAINSLIEADKMTEVLDLTGDPKKVGKYLFSDSSGMYRLQPHEQILINTMGMISYLMKNDLPGANVELRRAKSQERYWTKIKNQGLAKNPLVQFFGYIISLYRNKMSNLNYYKRELASLVGGASSDLLQGKNGSKDIVIIVLNGKAPVKKEVKERIHGTRIARLITHTGFRGDYLIYPKLVQRRNPFNLADVSINGNNFGQCADLLDVTSQAITRYEQEKDSIMIAAATRMAIRAAASTAAAVGTKEATKKSLGGSGGAVAGMFAGLIVSSSMEAADAADTRCWTLLPGNILVKRITGDFPDLSTISLNLYGNSSKRFTKQVKLKNGLNIIVFITPNRRAFPVNY